MRALNNFEVRQRIDRFRISTWCCISLVALTILGGCTPRVTRVELHDLGYEKYRISFNAIVKLHQFGKKSIPFLIDEISDRKACTLFSLVDPINSDYDIEGDYNCLGFLYAYIVELILAKETLAEADNFPCCQYLGSRLNCVFWDGMLRFSDGKAAQKKDLQEIKKVYKDWWRKNKHKSLRQLREDWRKGLVPLEKSKYYWR